MLLRHWSRFKGVGRVPVDSGFRLQGVGHCRASEPGAAAVWGLGFGIWGLGFGVWGKDAVWG